MAQVNPDRRPAVALDHAADIRFELVTADRPAMFLTNVGTITLHRSPGLPDGVVDRADGKQMER